MHTTYLLLGSNVGDRKVWMSVARTKITELIGAIENVSQLYETAAWGRTNQPAFINQALQVSTALSPKELLRCIRTIEDEAGRTRDVNWGPRTLDIDILMYDNVVVDTRELDLPHPRMAERKFVLAPLAEIAGEVIHPVLHLSISALLAQCADHSEVAILAEG